jgi:hypothetical protein
VRARLRDQSGIAVPTVLMLMVIMLLLGLAATQASIAGLSQATRDRQAKRALGAADAGADAAQWRLNHTVLAFDADGLLNLSNPSGTIQNVLQQGCVSVNAANIDLLNTGSYTGDFNPIIPDLNLPWCSTTAQGGSSEDLGDGATYTYRVSSAIRALSSGALVGMRRKVVVTGRVGNVTRRALVGLDLRLVSGSNWIPESLFTRTGWVECTATPPPGSTAPDAGCPQLPPFSRPPAG